MKKLFVLLMVACLAMPVVGCGKSSKKKSDPVKSNPGGDPKSDSDNKSDSKSDSMGKSDSKAASVFKSDGGTTLKKSDEKTKTN